MIYFLFFGLHRQPALLIALFFACCFVFTGCVRVPAPSPDPTYRTPSDLSGGKITGFKPEPGLENDPAAKAMLLACQQLPITSHSARSADLVITTGQFGTVPIHAMVVGDRVLMLPLDFITMGLNHALTVRGDFAPENSIGAITLIPGSKIAIVGKKQVLLRDPVLSVSTKDLVMNWADMQTLFHERDRQIGRSAFIQSFKIIYDLRDYHR